MVFFFGIVTAQDSTKNSLGISFGGSNFHILDKHASELIYSGIGIAPAIKYVRTNLKNNHFIEGSFYYYNLSSSSDNYKTIMIASKIRYCYVRTLLKNTVFNNQYSASAGVSITSFFMKSKYQFYMQTFWATAIESWYGSHSADVAVQFDYRLGESNKLKILFFIPIISNVSRPKYSSSGDYNYDKNGPDVKAFGSTKIIPHNFIFDSHFSYEHDLTKKLNLKVEYESYFAGCKKPDLIKLYMNNLRIGILYSL